MKNYLDKILLDEETNEFGTDFAEPQDRQSAAAAALKMQMDEMTGQQPDIQIPMLPEDEMEEPEVQEQVNDIVEADNAPNEMEQPDIVEQSLSQVSSAPLREPASVEPKMTPQQQLLEEFRKYKQQQSQQIQDARSKDADLELMNNMNKAFQQIGTGLASGYANVKMNPLDIKSDLEGSARQDSKDRLANMMQEYKLLSSGKEDEMTPYQKQAMKLRERELDIKERKAESKPEKELTPGQERADKEFGKLYSDFVAGGGSAAVESNLRKLDKVITRLEKPDDITGTTREKMLPFDYTRGIFAGEAQDVKDTVESVIQQSLRQTLGGQFAKEEAEQLVRRSYNPILSDEQNTERLKETIRGIKKMAETRQKAADHFEKFGTLTGFKGNLMNINDINPESAEESGTKQDPKIKKYSEDNNLDYKKAEKILRARGYDG